MCLFSHKALLAATAVKRASLAEAEAEEQPEGLIGGQGACSTPMSVVRVNFCWQFMNRRIKLCVQYIKEATTRVQSDKQEEGERKRERESNAKGKQGEDGGRNDA